MPSAEASQESARMMSRTPPDCNAFYGAGEVARVLRIDAMSARIDHLPEIGIVPAVC
jgi:hypothetical protein